MNGFEHPGLERITGITHKDSLASRRVPTKAGLKDAGGGRCHGWCVRVFAAQRDAR
jgi:RimJ/RimL family protein N-acetyltransferase